MPQIPVVQTKRQRWGRLQLLERVRRWWVSEHSRDSAGVSKPEIKWEYEAPDHVKNEKPKQK
jgi:hypothetical protein